MVELNNNSSLDKRILELGSQCWKKMQGEIPSLFDPQFWQGHILDWVMEDEDFKIDGFRFVEVLPALTKNRQIADHVQDYLLKENRNLPVMVRSALSMAAGGIASPLAVMAIKKNISEMARRFITEDDPDKAIQSLSKLNNDGFAFTADILGEASTSDKEAEQYLKKYLNLIELLGNAVTLWPDNKKLYIGPDGPLPRANVSVKVSALDPYMDPVDYHGSIGRLKERLLPLLRSAKKHNVFINFDLEQWAFHDITFQLFEEIATHPDLIDWPHLGLVVQAYLKESPGDCDRLLKLSNSRDTPFTVRLVKGAYWDYEVVNARQNGFACPVFTNKARTDACYEELSLQLLKNHQRIHPAFASHNLRSVLHAIVAAEKLNLDPQCLELQMLYGMAEPQRKILSDMGYRMRIYAPIGELLPGMGYLVRRLLENTSNSGFLRQSYHDGVDISNLLRPPKPGKEMSQESEMQPGDLSTPFANTAFLDFSIPEVRKMFTTALEAVQKSLPIKVPIVISGIQIKSIKEKQHPCPNNPETIVTYLSIADQNQAQQAINNATKSWPKWRDTSLSIRGKLLEKLADGLEKDRYYLAALQCFESGKPWKEADGDIAEAIDFCRYYARQALFELGPSEQLAMAGENNILFFEGRGPTVIIAPWNFPLAILCGMTAAALVAGNTVIIKPSSSAGSSGFELYKHLLDAGFDKDIVHFLPGSGNIIGDFLVEHPQIAQIAFTGSKEIGLRIIEKAGKTYENQPQVKKVVCEMGGKNGIIIDEDADLDAAIKGVMHSAFGYSGQKCSACSRLIIVGDIYNAFTERLIDACRSLPIKPAIDPGCRMGPVIDKVSFHRLSLIINNPPDGAEILFEGNYTSPGYFLPPVIFAVSDPLNPMMQEEYFGPILTIIKANSFNMAIEIANATDFALTGGVFSRNPSNLKKARKHFKVGNLYLNRGCTGALVQRQPFGGFAMSGTGTKAGGPGYLRLFADPRCITENTMRSGFTPDLQM